VNPSYPDAPLISIARSAEAVEAANLIACIEDQEVINNMVAYLEGK